MNRFELGVFITGCGVILGEVAFHATRLSAELLQQADILSEKVNIPEATHPGQLLVALFGAAALLGLAATANRKRIIT